MRCCLRDCMCLASELGRKRKRMYVTWLIHHCCHMSESLKSGVSICRTGIRECERCGHLGKGKPPVPWWGLELGVAALGKASRRVPLRGP
jgi:hypothetical protein